MANEAELMAQLEESQARMAELEQDRETLKAKVLAFESGPKANGKEDIGAKYKELEKAHAKTQAELAAEREEKFGMKLNAEFPDVPLDLIGSGTYDERKARAEKLKAFKDAKSTAPKPKTPESVGSNGGSDWKGTGSIAPSMDAEALAKQEDFRKRRDEQIKKGDSLGVANDIITASSKKLAGWFGAK